MKKILVPVDFSTYAENALKVAADIARKHNAEIITVHMMGISNAVLTKDHVGTIDSLFFVKLAQSKFEEFLNKPYLEGLSIQQVVKNYQDFGVIEELVIEHEADLIVMGSHGSSGLTEMFVGSNTEKVVRRSSVPVLVVKDTDDFTIKDAVFACDFREENLEVFKRAMAFFKLFDIEVKLLFVNLPAESFMNTSEISKRIDTFVNQLDPEDRFNSDDVLIYNDYTVESGVFNYADGIDIDMISLPTHGRKGLAHFFTGSIGEDIVNHAERPVLTFKI
ncbi:universal stress protein [Spongiivirga citrea]|uniref:Universal stress protein n=1 Tax=Spongiivirga citrea TaxID=1481457 RepID=A0A6M0CIU5_9FLAO|nr:universal stress protein [Spongiivirga citrea]NER17771.1 universal stress protein [Spongiivirga citrea]